MQTQHRPSPRDRIVIIGAGFGGFQAAQSLAGAAADVLLIDRHNYHTFVPLLYQVATAQLEPSLIAYPIRTKLRKMPNVRFLPAEVHRIDFDNKLVDTAAGLIPYDYLVLATGTQASFHGIPGAAAHTFGLKSLADAIALRHHLLTCIERAAITVDDDERRRLMTFLIVGGGATGVEMAGALAELLRDAMGRDFPELRGWGTIVLVQSGGYLLPEFAPRLGNYTHRHLEKLGVKVRLNTRLTHVSATQATLNEQEAIATSTVIWAAGIEAARPGLAQPAAAAKQGRFIVDDTLRLIDHPHVYALGDVAFLAQRDVQLSGVAPEALQQGVAVARNLRRQLQGDRPQPFRYFNKGRLAIIGGFGGVGRVLGMNLRGWLPWLMWLLVHGVYLPGYRSRLVVMLTWVQNYALGDRALRQRLPVVSSESVRQLDWPASGDR